MKSSSLCRTVALATSLVLVAACGEDASSDEATATTQPSLEWTTTDAEAAGLDPGSLEEVMSTAEEANSYCALVARDGEIVTERHFGNSAADEPNEVFSLTKSLTALLVGIAIDEGLLALDEPASDHITEWQDTESADVTVENLISNDSGRHWDFETDYTEMPLAGDTTQFAINLDQDQPPGEVWVYNNSAIQTLQAVLASATGQAVEDFAAERVFEPLGMENSSMAVDSYGNALTFMGLRTTCSDLARMGQLVLDGGTAADGTRVISEEFLTAATTPSTDLTAAYGYLWWLNRPGVLVNPLVATTGEVTGSTEEGQINEDVPEDVVWASGLFDQTLAVFPTEGMIGVRIGAAPPGDSDFNSNSFATGIYETLVD